MCSIGLVHVCLIKIVRLFEKCRDVFIKDSKIRGLKIKKCQVRVNIKNVRSNLVGSNTNIKLGQMILLQFFYSSLLFNINKTQIEVISDRVICTSVTIWLKWHFVVEIHISRGKYFRNKMVLFCVCSYKLVKLSRRIFIGQRKGGHWSVNNGRSKRSNSIGYIKVGH